MSAHPIEAVLDRCLELRLSDPAAALEEIEVARKLPLAAPPVDIEPYRASLDAAEAACLRNLGQNEDARRIADAILSDPSTTDDHYARATAWLVIGGNDLSEGKHAAALEHARAGLEHAEKTGSSRLRASALNLLGGTAGLLGSLQEAENALRKAVLIAPLDSRIIPLASSTLGGVLGALGDSEGALQAYAKSLAGHRSTDHRRGIAWALYNLASTYASLERWDAAERAIEECLGMLSGSDGGARVEDRELPAFAHPLRGRIALATGHPDRARECYERGREIARGIGNPAREGRCLRGLGECALRAGDGAAAIARFEEALGLLDDAEHPRETDETRIGLADALLALDRIAEAEELYERTLERAEAADHIETRTAALRLGARIAERRGDFESALRRERRRIEVRERAQEVVSRRRFEESALTQELERARYREGVLRSAKDELEARVAERTAQLERANAELRRGLEERARAEEERRRLEEQLHHAQRMDSIGRMASGVSHDLNNVLSVILGRGDHLLRSDLPADEDRRSVDMIITAAERASAIVRQLLTFSRRHPHDRRDLDLATVLTDLEPTFRSILPASITLEVERVGRPRVEGDRTRIEQVLLNLVLNARDAIDGRGRIVIRAETITDASGTAAARLRVEDDGAGIAPEHLGRIFEPYFTTKSPGSGTGMGLATAYGIVRQHEGTIEVESTPGEGTAFLATFPLLEDPEAEDDAAPPARDGAPTTLRLAIVEGDPDLRATLASNLRALGHSVDEIADARTLVEPTDEAAPFEVVIAPLVLRDLTGIELLERVRRHTPGQRFLFTSGQLASQVILPEGSRFLAKPFRLSDLLEQLDRLARSR